MFVIVSSCRIIETNFIPQYYLSLDKNMTYGKIYYSTDSIHWTELQPNKHTLVDSDVQFYFKAVGNHTPYPYDFEAWQGDVTGNHAVSNPLRVNKDVTIAATFKIRPYTISIHNPLQGIFSYSTDGTIWQTTTGNVSADQTITFKVTPNTGYQFKQWIGDVSMLISTGDKTQPQAGTFYLTSNITMLADFGNLYTATLGNITGDGTLQYNLDNGSVWHNFPATDLATGTTIYVKATPAFNPPTNFTVNDGVYWKYGNMAPALITLTASTPPSPTSGATPYIGSFVVNSNLSLSATFLPQYNLHLNTPNPDIANAQNYITYTLLPDATASSTKVATNQLIDSGNIYFYVNLNPNVLYNYTISSNNATLATYKSDTSYRTMKMNKNSNLQTAYQRIPTPNDWSNPSNAYVSSNFPNGPIVWGGNLGTVNSFRFKIAGNNLSYLDYVWNGAGYYFTSMAPLSLYDATTYTYVAYNVVAGGHTLNVYITLATSPKTIKIEDAGNHANYGIFYW